MLFQVTINLNEEDYLSFNNFHSFESVYGKKMIRKHRFFFTLIMVILAALCILVRGLTIFSVIYSVDLMLITLLYMLFLKKVLSWITKAQIKQFKKTGKLPYDPVSTFEFYEDKMVEITPSNRTEQGYNIFERVCVVKDRYIILYKNIAVACILPVAQIKAQLNQEDLIDFLSKKCTNVEYY